MIDSRAVISPLAQIAADVEIGDFAILGGLSAVHQFTKVGAYCFIANNAAVTRDVPPYVMAVGQPAEPHSVNAVGLKRRGFTEEQIRNVRRAYRVLYRSGLKLAEASAELGRLAPEQPELQALVDFLPRVTRSLVR